MHVFLDNIEAQCESEIQFILGQGVGLFKLNDGWSGNLNIVNNTSGYWLNSNSSCVFEYEINGFSDECLAYDLSGGNNLVSYAGEDNAETVKALGGDVLSALFTFILGQGQGLFATDNGWSGNLTTLENKKGYWLNSNIPNPSFKWGTECENVEPVAKEITENKLPEEYQFEQSTSQAFYLINEILIDENHPEASDLILAYNGNVLVGSAKYNDEITVLPIMGRDVSEQTVGFLEEGEKPQLKLYQSSTCALIDLQANLDGFRNVLVSEVESVMGNIIVIPEEYTLNPAYPNPFNPVTTIKFGVPLGTLNAISIEIFDINGRHIETLINGEIEPGNHSVEWNATGLSSGVYFVKMSMDPSKSLEQGFIQTQKLVLMK